MENNNNAVALLCLFLALFVTSVAGFIDLFEKFMPGWMAGLVAFYSTCLVMLGIVWSGKEDYDE